MSEYESTIEITIDGQVLHIRRAEVAEIVDLRHRVLRAGLPRSAALFDGDVMPTSRHFAAFLGNNAVSCASFHRSMWETEPAWQLRGMATDEAFRGRGVGGELLTFAERSVKAEGPTLMWANARIGAIKFYTDRGWDIVSDLFEIPTAGMHYRILKRG
jgi:GNAT superfamily N-acetyltransferase